MSPGALADLARDALLLAITLSLPFVAVAAVVGFGVSVFLSAFHVQDPALAHLPKLVAVTAALVMLGPWMGHQIGAFSEHVVVMAAAR